MAKKVQDVSDVQNYNDIFSLIEDVQWQPKLYDEYNVPKELRATFTVRKFNFVEREKLRDMVELRDEVQEKCFVALGYESKSDWLKKYFENVQAQQEEKPLPHDEKKMSLDFAKAIEETKKKIPLSMVWDSIKGNIVSAENLKGKKADGTLQDVELSIDNLHPKIIYELFDYVQSISELSETEKISLSF